MSTAAANSSENGKADKASAKVISFSLPSTDKGKQRMVKELELMAKLLQFNGVTRWSFSASRSVEKHLGIAQKIDATVENPAEYSDGGPPPLGNEENDVGQSKPEGDSSCEKVDLNGNPSQENNSISNDLVNGVCPDEREGEEEHDKNDALQESLDNAQAATIQKEEE